MDSFKCYENQLALGVGEGEEELKAMPLISKSEQKEIPCLNTVSSQDAGGCELHRSIQLPAQPLYGFSCSMVLNFCNTFPGSGSSIQIKVCFVDWSQFIDAYIYFSPGVTEGLSWHHADFGKARDAMGRGKELLY